ncbi:MAG: universal stress protein [Flavobacteriaceae bacterium]|nr:universal stress protein [Flavobacteriaceae bacterium]
MKKILLPTDFSETARNALEYALNFFKGGSCTFYLLNIYPAGKYTTGDLWQASGEESIYDSLLLNKKIKLDVLIDQLEQKYQDKKYRFKGIADYDEFSHAINQVVELNKINFIVMGTEGSKGVKEVVFGTHTQKVIQKVDCPILVVPKGVVFKGFKKILLTLDTEDKFNPSAIKPLISLMAKHKVSLDILRMKKENANSDDLAKEEKKIERSFKGTKPKIHMLSEVHTVDAINSLVQIMGIDMNVISAKKELFLDRVLFGSSVSKIINRSRIPLLVLHEPPQ